MTPDELMDRAADLLDANGWTTGTLYRDNGEMCILGALNKTVYPEWNGNVPPREAIERLPFSDLPAFLIDTRRFLEKSFGMRISSWNDMHCTDRDEAAQVLRSEAKRYREEIGNG
jgi:hypothetical protein